MGKYDDRMKWIEYKGKRIFSLDFSNFSPEQMIEFLDDEKLIKLEASEPVGTIISLNNYENVHFSLNLLNKVNKLTVERSKYYKATANLGVTGLVKVLLDAASKFMKQRQKNCSNRNEALDWLASL